MMLIFLFYREWTDGTVHPCPASDLTPLQKEWRSSGRADGETSTVDSNLRRRCLFPLWSTGQWSPDQKQTLSPPFIWSTCPESPVWGYSQLLEVSPFWDAQQSPCLSAGEPLWHVDGCLPPQWGEDPGREQREVRSWNQEPSHAQMKNILVHKTHQIADWPLMCRRQVFTSEMEITNTWTGTLSKSQLRELSCLNMNPGALKKQISHL